MRYFVCLIILAFKLNVKAQNSISELYKMSFQQFKIGKYDDALITNINALKLAEKTKNCDQIAYAYLQVGKMHYYNKEIRLALSCFFKSKVLADSCKIDSIQHIVNHNIGSMYVDFNELDSALFFLSKAKGNLEVTKKYIDLSKVNAAIAQLYLIKKQPDFDLAETFVLDAEKYAEKSQNKISLAFAAMKRGLLNEKLKRYREATISYNSALIHYTRAGVIEGRINAMGKILNMKFILKDNDLKQFTFRFLNLKDSVYRAEGANKIAEYKTIYETEKKEQENKLLQQENNLNQAKLETRNRTIIILVFAIVLIAIIIVWRVNASKLKKKQLELQASEKLQKEKERISRDLHDNVGGQLSYVLYSLDDLDHTDTSKRNEIKTNINESVRSVIQNLRETIWAINDQSLTINDLSDKLKVYSRAMFKNSNTKIIFSEHIESDIILNSLVGLNLYRICQEIINNAFKYSKATELKITITSQEKASIVIADNGKGFDLNEQSEGFGLKNIHDRTQEIGASVTLNASKNQGVTYTIVV